MQNNLGFLNAPLVALITLPPFDLIFNGLLNPIGRAVGRFPARYVPNAALPVRVMSLAGGITTAKMTPDWAALLVSGPQLGPILVRLIAADSTLTATGDEVDDAEDATSYAVQFAFYLGKRWVTENTFHNSSSGLSISGAAHHSSRG